MQTGAQQNPPKRGLRVLRLLTYWAGFVIILFLIHTHQRLSEKTHLNFGISLKGIPAEATVHVDGRPITSGDRISIGRHTVAISHPKAARFSTNIFVWYGRNDLGQIALTRATGQLILNAAPAADFITIESPEVRLDFTNSTGITSSVPTDTYVISAHYSHWDQKGEAYVLENSPAVYHVFPKLGVLDLSCDKSNASFEILTADGRLIERGAFPATICGVPEAAYALNAQHGRNRQTSNVFVKAAETNRTLVKFIYGTALLETKPEGATVIDENGTQCGMTPLSLSDVLVGERQFSVRLDGYEPTPFVLGISEGETNLFQTNLTSRTYSSDITTARQLLAVGDYDRALPVAEQALVLKPGDETASGLIRAATTGTNVNGAEALGRNGNYQAAIKQLQLAISSDPDNQRARALLSEFTRYDAEQREKERQERMKRPQAAFEKILARHKDASLFERHEVKTGKEARVVAARIRDGLRDETPRFTFGGAETESAEVMTIIAKQESQAVGRICVIVVGQQTAEETEILYEVLEYKGEPIYKQVLGSLLKAPVESKYVPLHPSRVGPLTDKMKDQIEEGNRIISRSIQAATN